MANFNMNKVILGGRLTNDVELKTTPNGVSVATFSLAVNRKVGAGKEAQTDFINCQAWRGTAEFISKYFRKGSSLCVVGSIQTRSWTDKDGAKRYATEVIVDEAMFVDSKSDNAPAQTPPPSYMPEAYAAPKMEEIADDDDLPF